MLKAVGEFFDSLFHIIWELFKVFGLAIFFIIILIGEAVKWILKAGYTVTLKPPIWAMKAIYQFLKDAFYGRGRRKRQIEIEKYGED